MLRISLFLLALLPAAAAMPVAARPHPATFVPLGAAADAPNGFMELCGRDAAACGARGSLATIAGKPHAIARGADVAPCIAVGPDLRAPLAHSLPLSDTGIACSGAAIHQMPIASMFHSASLADRPIPEAAPIRRGDGDRRLIEAVNRRVNRGVRQVSDLDRFGVEERWERTGIGPRLTGDCEDIALEKQAELIGAGLPAARLLLATVYRPGIGLHTILVARLEEGDVVLDSLTTRIKPWQRTGYSWLRVQSPSDPLTWRAVAPA